MATIEKLYGTKLQSYDLADWLINNCENPEPFLDRMFDPNMWPERNDTDEIIIANFTEEQDEWFWINCKLDFVLNRLEEQYSNETRMKWTKKYQI